MPDFHADDMNRSDIHNVSVDETVAGAGLCGFIHLPTGRTCILPARHSGSCRFEPHPEAKQVAQTMRRLPDSPVWRSP
jgi:hypothetical protein